jgi:hypothetical protein
MIMIVLITFALFAIALALPGLVTLVLSGMDTRTIDASS